MAQNRTKASLLTIFSNTGTQVLVVLLEFLVRSVFIYKLGEAYLGISGLFKNILGVLSLVDLGIGNAITYYLYKPAAVEDHERLKTLLHLYKVVYNLIGAIILFIGMALMPLLPYLVRMEVELPINLYLVYFLYVLNSTLTYFLFAYKALIFTAYQQMYKVSAVRALTTICSSAMAIFLLLTVQSFYAYLFCLIAGTVSQNLILGHMADEKFPFLRDKSYTKISRTELKGIFKNVYAAFIFKIGNISLSSTDNILVSMICGTIVVGYFSNYNLIVRAVQTLYSGFVTALLPSVGNLNARESDEKQLKMLWELNFLNSWVLSFCTISLMLLLPPFIELWTRNTGNANYLLPQSIPILLALNFWIQNYMDIVAHFKDTKGLLWYGKYLQLGMGMANLLLSVFWGQIWGLVGIVAATGISILAVSFFPYPYFLFHYGYQKSVIPFYITFFKDFLLLLLGYGAVRVLSLGITRVTVGTFVYQCLLCAVVPNLIIYFAKRKSEEMQMARQMAGRICHQILKR